MKVTKKRSAVTTSLRSNYRGPPICFYSPMLFYISNINYVYFTVVYKKYVSKTKPENFMRFRTFKVLNFWPIHFRLYPLRWGVGVVFAVVTQKLFAVLRSVCLRSKETKNLPTNRGWQGIFLTTKTATTEGLLLQYSLFQGPTRKITIFNTCNFISLTQLHALKRKTTSTAIVP